MGKTEDVFSGLGHGLASLVGLGEYDDPLGDLQGDLSSAIQDQNLLTAQMAPQWAVENQHELEAFMGYQQKVDRLLSEGQQYNQNFSNIHKNFLGQVSLLNIHFYLFLKIFLYSL